MTLFIKVNFIYGFQEKESASANLTLVVNYPEEKPRKGKFHRYSKEVIMRNNTNRQVPGLWNNLHQSSSLDIMDCKAFIPEIVNAHTSGTGLSRAIKGRLMYAFYPQSTTCFSDFNYLKVVHEILFLQTFRYPPSTGQGNNLQPFHFQHEFRL